VNILLEADSLLYVLGYFELIMYSWLDAGDYRTPRYLDVSQFNSYFRILQYQL
jgi:hypothetical protein